VSIPKTYILYYDWPNTSGNHAGMAYLVKELKKTYPGYTKLIEIPQTINKWTSKLQRLHFYFLTFYLKVILSKSDKVLFMEYLGNISGNQTGLAIKLRDLKVKNTFIGLVHLSGNNLLELYGTNEYPVQGAEAVDRLLTFGSSLADFFVQLGFENKVITTFHYVDTSFYKPSEITKSELLQVILIGSLKRNFRQLVEIVTSCPEIEFHICQGHNNLSEYFHNQRNIKLYNFLSETELLRLMQSCHVSLSIFDDTVGSNVITTSMACGLVNVVSDVGSIRDYCNDKNAILCKENEDFTVALLELAKDKKLREKISAASIEKAQKINLKESISFFGTILVND
jgi:glycosyltransferase involved in cell wall biosynthesis